MKNITIICLLLVALLVACKGDATITVKNNIPNISIEKVSFDGYSVAYRLLPGEKDGYKIVDEEDRFPKSSQIVFYMVKGDSRVYLKTKEVFTLKDGDDLLVEISENTKVVNGLQPAKKSAVELSDYKE